MSERRRVLLTGAAGTIGTVYRRQVGDRYAFRLVDIKEPAEPAGHETMVVDLADPASAHRACEGMDTVIHLAADPRTTAEFYSDLLEPNFKGTYNIYRAAADTGCKRLVFASSVNAVGGYSRDRQVRATDAPAPGNVYGVSKAFGESLGAYFGYREGLSNISIRIGAVGPLERIKPETPDFVRSIYITYRDLCHLLDRCVETPNIRHAVVHGVSNNRHNWLDLTETMRMLDYHPVDDAFNP